MTSSEELCDSYTRLFVLSDSEDPPDGQSPSKLHMISVHPKVVSEIDYRLQPSYQRRAVLRLPKKLPCSQMKVTGHSCGSELQWSI